ncbi:hypothetical protein DM860_017855 [Cuscuta australis]|nr:hypothetical protein DM860_017855 [Cuscuta australis]
MAKSVFSITPMRIEREKQVVGDPHSPEFAVFILFFSLTVRNKSERREQRKERSSQPLSMASVMIEACTRRRKRSRRGPYPFEKFAAPGTVDGLSGGVFRDDVRLFLQEFAGVEDYSVAGMPVWSVWLVESSNGALFPLYIVEESVQSSPEPFCDYCKFAGWGHHFVSKRRYHFIIPANANWEKPLGSDCLQIEAPHTLHGIIHCNGYGHFLCINALSREESHSNLRGTDFMDFWDRLCTALKTRNVSVFDVSMKGGMDLRLLYGVTYGMSWFGKWGYKFNRGSFGVTEQIYQKAIESLQSLGLDKILNDFQKLCPGRRRKIKQVIEKYREMSEETLITISELLQFIMRSPAFTTHQIQKTNYDKSMPGAGKRNNGYECDPIPAEGFLNMLAKSDCRWSLKRLEMVLCTIVDLLKERCGGMMTRQELRDRARLCVGDTGLIDYVLKSISCVSLGNHTVRRSRNPITKLLEFSIAGETEAEKFPFLEGVVHPSSTRHPSTKRVEFLAPCGNNVGGGDIYDDLKLLYDSVLLAYPAGRVILDSKQFVKEWGSFQEDATAERMALTCQVLPSFEELETELTRPLSPGEVVVVPGSITIGELKRVAQSALRDTYCVMERLEVRQVGGLRGMEEERAVMGCVGGGAHVWVRGRGLDLETEMRYQDGGSTTNSTVECICGTREDDGERMVECEGCQVWQHTRCCCGIDDGEDAPAVFLCRDCAAAVVAGGIRNG